MIRRPKEKPGVGFAQHRGVVVRITGGHRKEVQRFERSYPMLLWVLHPHVVVHNAATPVDFQLIAEESRKAQLSHKRLGELIERVRQNNHLITLPQPREEVSRSF